MRPPSPADALRQGRQAPRDPTPEELAERERQAEEKRSRAEAKRQADAERLRVEQEQLDNWASMCATLYVQTLNTLLVQRGGAGLVERHVPMLYTPARGVALMLPTMGPVGQLVLMTTVAGMAGSKPVPNYDPITPGELSKILEETEERIRAARG